MVVDDVGGYRLHFQLWKEENFQMKHCNKIGVNQKKTWMMVCIHDKCPKWEIWLFSMKKLQNM